jgi:hypothetical protein
VERSTQDMYRRSTQRGIKTTSKMYQRSYMTDWRRTRYQRIRNTGRSTSGGTELDIRAT